MSVRGNCLCAAVAYKITGECSDMLNCHCSLCRKSHGSLFATYSSVSKDNLDFTSGEQHIRSHAVSPHLARTWCDICGSTLPFLEGDFYSVPAGTLIDPCPAEVVGHIFTSSRVSWYEITDQLRQFDTFPASMARPPVQAQHHISASGGSCVCGSCQFELTGEPLLMMNCHCDRCKRSRSAAHATNIFYASENIHWISGKSLIRQFKLPGARRFGAAFCEQCGSLMPHEGAERTNIPVGCLDFDPLIRPTGHIYVSYKADWFNITDDLPQFETSYQVQDQ